VTRTFRLVICAGLLAASLHTSAAQPTADTMDHHALIEAAEQAIARASGEIAQGDWPAASTRLKNALTALGDRHARPGLIDDSGMKLIAADDLERKGQPENAARLRLRILQERLRWFREKP
jgi:hypothetical protein